MSGTNGKSNGRGNGKADNPATTDSTGGIRDELGRIKPGHTLNPAGARRSYAAQIRAQMRTMLEEPVDADGTRSRMQQLLLTVYEHAVEGDMVAAKIILDRVLPATLALDVGITGMAATEALDVFGRMRTHFVEAGQLPDLKDRQ